jgi:hypothetical protein
MKQLIFLFLATCLFAQVKPSYTYISFDVPGSTDTAPVAINDNGEIVGTSPVMFIRTNKGVIKRVPYKPQLTPTSINSSGWIVGEILGKNSIGGGFVRAPTGELTIFDSSNGGRTGIMGINDTLNCTGLILDGNGQFQDAFTWQNCNGTKPYVKILIAGATYIAPSAINSTGNVGGNYGIRKQGGWLGFFWNASTKKATRINAPGAAQTFVAGMNDADTVVGNWWVVNSVQHGFSRSVRGVFTEFDPPGSIFTAVSGINTTGLIAGSYEDSSQVVHGFIYNPAKELFTVIDYPGAVWTVVRAINAGGHVTGSWQADINGTMHGFVY